MDQLLPFALFIAFLLSMLILDLGVFHKTDKVDSLRTSLLWTIFWIALALLFNGWVYYALGLTAALEFLTGYIIEKSLSVDNIFVFIFLFKSFAIPQKYQHKVLFWGIFSALIFRGIMIAIGIELITRFNWIIYVFGALLIYAGLQALVYTENKGRNFKDSVNWIRKIIPVSEDYVNGHFFIRKHGQLLATPLFFCLAAIEIADVVFAVDSIPAILAITSNPFIVFTSNAFAILGLRSLYFVMGSAVQSFRYLHHGVAIVLIFVGSKMLAHGYIKLSVSLSLEIIAAILLSSILASIYSKSE